MKSLKAATFVLVLIGLAGTVKAEDKPNPTGTWKWSVTFNNQTRERTLKLKLEGDKLTGAMVGRDGKDQAIEDATFKDGEVAFKYTRERNGQKITTKYTGKVTGDVLKGKAETERDGQTQSQDFEAKRDKS